MNSERPRPTTDQVSKVFRNLADRHAEERSRVSMERSWTRLQSKLLGRSGMPHSPKALRLLGPARQIWARTAIDLCWHLGRALRGFSPALAGAACLLALGIGLGASGWVHWNSDWGSLWGSSPRAAQNLTYDVKPLGTGHAHQVLQADGWLRTDTDGAELEFSDGSRIQMRGQSALRLEVTGEHGADAELSSGSLHADILHADTTRWRLHAGPYRVDVVGTQFDLAYGSAGFSLVMHAGRVRITGPQGRSWTLDAGQNLRLPGEVPATAEPQATSTSEAAVAEGSSVLGPSANQSDKPTPIGAKAPNSAPQRADAQRSWPELVAKGQFQRVLDEAKALGGQFPGPQASEAQIAAAAQAAGYSGDSRFAERCWRYLRKHHARSAGSARAAFYLARIAEQRGDLREALDWLGVYNKESPGGAFSAEALGRQLLILRRIDPTAPKAVEAARDYLRRFPEGAHKEAAQATLGVSRNGR